MNENILSDILRNLTGGWYLDIKFLVDTLEEYKIDFDDVMESIEANFWENVKLDFNLIIYETLTFVAHKFIDENSELFETHQNDFTIYCNYMDSHVYFEDEEIQNRFESYF